MVALLYILHRTSYSSIHSWDNFYIDDSQRVWWMPRRGCFVVLENTHMSRAWFAIGCIGCLWHSASGSNCVWWCTKQCTDLRLYNISQLCEQSCVDGRTRSSVRSDLVVRRTRTKFGERAFVVADPAAWNHYRAPSATLHPWTVSRRLWKHLCFYLISDWLYITFLLLHAPYLSIGLWFVVCTASLNRSSCYGALEIIVTLLLLLLLLFLFIFYYYYSSTSIQTFTPIGVTVAEIPRYSGPYKNRHTRFNIWQNLVENTRPFEIIP